MNCWQFMTIIVNNNKLLIIEMKTKLKTKSSKIINMNANKNKSMNEWINGLKLFKFNFNNKCIYKTKSKSHLKQDINIVNKKLKELTCVWPQCGQRFGLLSTLRAHQLIHSGIKRFKCDLNVISMNVIKLLHEIVIWKLIVSFIPKRRTISVIILNVDIDSNN